MSGIYSGSDSVPQTFFSSVRLYRRLRRAVEQGLVRQDGLGKCKNPFRYWLPEAEARWRCDPMALLRMPELFGLRPG